MSPPVVKRKVRALAALVCICLLLLLAIALFSRGDSGSQELAPAGSPAIPDPIQEVGAPDGSGGARLPRAGGALALEVSCVSRAGDAVADAQLRLYRDGEVIAAGSSDATGSGRLALSAGRETVLEVVARGFARHVESLPDPLPERIVCILEPGWEVRGHVTWPDGQPVGAGVHVFAWSSGPAPSAEDFRAAIEGGPPAALHWTSTDPEGSFDLSGLDAARRSFLVAAGHGGTCVERLGPLRPSGEPIHVEIVPVLAARIELRNEAGLPPRCDPRLFGFVSWQMRDERAQSFSRIESRPELDFVGPNLLYSAQHGSRDDMTLVYWARDRVDHLGPFEFGANLPGHEPRLIEAIALPSELPLPVTRLTLPELDTEWGRLSVRLTGPAAVFPPPTAETRILGWVYLTGEASDPYTGEPVSYQFTVPEPGTTALRLNGVPAGRYRWIFSSAPGSFTVPREVARKPSRRGEDRSGSLEIPPGGIAELEIPLDGSGCVEVLVEDAAGRAFPGSLDLELRPEDNPNQVAGRWHAGPPHSIAGLLPRSYLVRATRARGEPLAPVPEARVLVRADARSSVTLRLPLGD